MCLCGSMPRIGRRSVESRDRFSKQKMVGRSSRCKANFRTCAMRVRLANSYVIASTRVRAGDEHELWWLTEMSKRKAEAAAQAAQDALEEGAETSSDEEADDSADDDPRAKKGDALIEDDDPPTEEEPAPESQPAHLPRLPERSFTAEIAWASQGQNESPGSSSLQ